MKFSLSLTALALFLSGGDAARSKAAANKLSDLKAKRRLHNEFMHAMHSDGRIQASRKAAFEQKKKEKFYEKLVGSARKLADGEYQQYQNGNGQYQNANGQYQNANGQYQNANGQYQNANGQYQNANGQYQNANGNNQNANGNYQNADANGYGAYQNADGEWEYGYNQYGYEMNVEFDLTARAFKYSACAAIKSYDQDNADDNGDPMTIKTYAVFRLCPADSCNKYSMTGCGKNYGEYAVEMSTYLSYVLEYYEERYEEYCEFCAPCDFEYQYFATQSLQQCYEEKNQQEWASNQAAQQQAWQDYYAANGGDMAGYNAGGNQYSSAYNGGNGFNNYNQYYNGAQQQNNYRSGYNNANNGHGSNWYGSSNWASNNGNGYDGNKNNGYSYNGKYYSGSNQQANANNKASNYQGQGANQDYYKNKYGEYYGQNHDYGYDENPNDRKLMTDGARQLYSWWNYNKNNNNNNNNNANNANNNANYDYNAAEEDVDEEEYYPDCPHPEAQDYNRFLEQANANYNYNQNAQNGQNGQNIYGYYDENGEWVEGEDGGAAQNGQGYWGADGVWYQFGEGEYQDNMNYLCLCEDGSICDECEYLNELQYGVCDDYICKDYYTYCSDFYGSYEEKQKFDVMDYLECQQYENEYGQKYYVAPHCGSDHYTISLGVFSDANCANYLGETVTLSKVLGYKYNDEDLFKLPKDCISCDGIEEMVEDQENQDNGDEYGGRYDYYNEGTYVKQPDTDNDGVVAMCTTLYMASAQCNTHMKNYAQISLYKTDLELKLEERYCSFIENIVYGAFDEQGEILLKSEQFDFADWRNPSQYKKLKMPAGQAIGLALSVILCVAMAATAIYTQRSLTRQSTPWRPKRVTDASSPVQFSRQNSGIVMGRSRSGPGTAPLI